MCGEEKEKIDREREGEEEESYIASQTMKFNLQNRNIILQSFIPCSPLQQGCNIVHLKSSSIGNIKVFS